MRYLFKGEHRLEKQTIFLFVWLGFIWGPYPKGSKGQYVMQIDNMRGKCLPLCVIFASTPNHISYLFKTQGFYYTADTHLSFVWGKGFESHSCSGMTPELSQLQGKCFMWGLCLDPSGSVQSLLLTTQGSLLVIITTCDHPSGARIETNLSLALGPER